MVRHLIMLILTFVDIIAKIILIMFVNYFIWYLSYLVTLYFTEIKKSWHLLARRLKESSESSCVRPPLSSSSALKITRKNFWSLQYVWPDAACSCQIWRISTLGRWTKFRCGGQFWRNSLLVGRVRRKKSGYTA